jgi:hypothetical protein
MKTIYIPIFLFAFNILTQAQIGVEKESVDGSGLMDFPTGTTKGIILPQVENNTTMADISAGTFVFDGATSKTKYYDGTAWIEMTGENGISPSKIIGAEHNVTKGVIVGAEDSTANGVLVFESEDKALILPKVIDPVNNVKSPAAGMMCYDPVAKLVCLYNGATWSFWGNIN